MQGLGLNEWGLLVLTVSLLFFKSLSFSSQPPPPPSHPRRLGRHSTFPFIHIHERKVSSLSDLLLGFFTVPRCFWVPCWTIWCWITLQMSFLSNSCPIHSIHRFLRSIGIVTVSSRPGNISWIPASSLKRVSLLSLLPFICPHYISDIVYVSCILLFFFSLTSEESLFWYRESILVFKYIS